MTRLVNRIGLITGTYTDLCRLADFLTDSLPLVILIVLDGIEKSLALILGKFGVVHVLVKSAQEARFPELHGRDIPYTSVS